MAFGKTKSRKAWRLAVMSLIASSVLAAGGITIDTRTAPYNGSGVDGVGTGDLVEVRTGALTNVAAKYRLLHGIDTLDPGSIFKVIYQDGTGENGSVVSTTSTMGATPIPGTQFDISNGQCSFFTVCNSWGSFG